MFYLQKGLVHVGFQPSDPKGPDTAAYSHPDHSETSQIFQLNLVKLTPACLSYGTGEQLKELSRQFPENLAKCSGGASAPARKYSINFCAHPEVAWPASGQQSFQQCSAEQETNQIRTKVSRFTQISWRLQGHSEGDRSRTMSYNAPKKNARK